MKTIKRIKRYQYKTSKTAKIVFIFILPSLDEYIISSNTIKSKDADWAIIGQKCDLAFNTDLT